MVFNSGLMVIFSPQSTRYSSIIYQINGNNGQSVIKFEIKSDYYNYAYSYYTGKFKCFLKENYTFYHSQPGDKDLGFEAEPKRKK